MMVYDPERGCGRPWNTGGSWFDTELKRVEPTMQMCQECLMPKLIDKLICDECIRRVVRRLLGKFEKELTEVLMKMAIKKTVSDFVQGDKALREQLEEHGLTIDTKGEIIKMEKLAEDEFLYEGDDASKG